jgi:hypothetical protein
MESLEINMETKKSNVGLSRSDSRVQSCSRVGQDCIGGDGSLRFRVEAQESGIQWNLREIPMWGNSLIQNKYVERWVL